MVPFNPDKPWACHFLPVMALLVIIVLLSQGCMALQVRKPLPEHLLDQAQVADLPGIRAWGDVQSESLEQSAIESVHQEMAANQGNLEPEAYFLALSGGGGDGAFGAGILCGWTAAGTRPKFKLVTGISTGAMDLLAVVGTPVRQMRSPAQPEALTYGSAFSRGALIRQPDVSLIQLSGTAAIDRQGRSLYPGDVRAQIDCTFEKIAALIGQEGATLANIAAASVFVKHPENALVYQERALDLGLKNLPAVVMVADVCRPELLFEVDAEVAFQPAPSRC